MATYSISKDPTATNLTISKNSSNQVFITKNPGNTKAYFTKSGGTEVSLGKGEIAAAIAADIYDDFTDTANTPLDSHTVTPLPVLSPPTWASIGVGTFKINGSNEVVVNAAGSYSSYIIEAGVVAQKISADVSVGSNSGLTGFVIRGNSGGTAGVYITITNELVPPRIKIEVRNWATAGQIGTTGYIGYQIYNSYKTICVEDSGTALSIYVEGDSSNSIDVTTSLNNTLTNVGLYSEGVASAPSYKNFKAFF